MLQEVLRPPTTGGKISHVVIVRIAKFYTPVLPRLLQDGKHVDKQNASMQQQSADKKKVAVLEDTDEDDHGRKKKKSKEKEEPSLPPVGVLQVVSMAK